MLCSALVCVPLSVIATFCVTTLWPQTEVKLSPAIAAEDRLHLWQEATVAQCLLVMGLALLVPWAWASVRKKPKEPEEVGLPQTYELRQLQQQLLESYLPKKRCQFAESQRARKSAYRCRHNNSSPRADYEYVLQSEALVGNIGPVETHPVGTETGEENKLSLPVDRKTITTSSVTALPPISEMGISKSPSTVTMADAQTETESVLSAEPVASLREMEIINSSSLEKSLSAFKGKVSNSTLPEDILPSSVDNKEANTHLNEGSPELMELLLPRHLRDAISANSIMSETDELLLYKEQSTARGKPVGIQQRPVRSDGTSVSQAGDAPNDIATELHLGKSIDEQKNQTVTLSLAAFPCGHEDTQMPRPSECKSLPTSPKRGGATIRGQRRVTCTRCLNTRSQPATNSSIHSSSKPPTATIISTGLGPLTSPRSEGHPTPRTANHHTAGSREPRKPIQHQHPSSRNLTPATNSQGCPRNKQCYQKK